MSVKTKLLVNAESEKAIDTLLYYKWPRGTKFIKDGKVFILESQLDEGGFEDIVTGIALHVAKQCPGVQFFVLAELHNIDNYYIEKIVVESDGCDLVVNVSLKDQMFTSGKKCVRCGQILNSVYNDTEFTCPKCKALYKSNKAENPMRADYNFGEESATYTIPREEIDK